MPKSVPPMIADSFIAIIPGAVPLLLANTVRCIFTYTNYKCDQLRLQSFPAAFDGSWRNVAGCNPRRLPYEVVLAVRYPRHIARQLSHIIPPKCQNNGLLLPYQFNGANADTAGLIGDFQSARISLEELN